MTLRAIKIDEIRHIEESLRRLMKDMAETEGPLDVDSEFRSLVTAKSESNGPATDKLREMSRRFGPKFAELLGIPPVAGACRACVADRGIRALVEIDPPAGAAPAVSVDDVQKILQSRGIVHGIDGQAVAQAVERGKTESVRDACVAQGTPPTDGCNGRIQPDSEGEVVTAEAGRKIAALVPPEPGAPGRDVFGNPVPAKPVTPVSPNVGPNVSFDAHAGVFYAKSSGRVVISGDAINVESLLAIPSDVDITVGDVNFPGELVIKGWVRSRMAVTAEKDILIRGGVEDAQVTSSQGSISVQKGIQGRGTGMISAKWDVQCGFIEQATVIAGGVIRTSSAVGAELAAGECVEVTAGRGVVIGGRIYAGQRVDVRELGAGAGTPTVVQLGISPPDLAALTKLKRRRQTAQKGLEAAESAMARFGLSAEDLQAAAATEEGMQLFTLAKTVLVLNARLQKILDEESRLVESMKRRTDGVLLVRGCVHPGVKIHIGGASCRIDQPMTSVKFKYDPDRRRIVTAPYL